MPWLAAALPYIGMAMSAAGTIAAGDAQKKAGIAQRQAAQHRASLAERDAQAMEIQAGQERASAQRNLSAERKNQRRVESAIQARAASSGGGALDPSIIDILGDVGSEGDYRALGALYAGEDRGRALEYGAMVNRARGDGERFAGQAAYEAGKRAQRVSNLSAAATIAGGAGSMYSKYGRPETRPATARPTINDDLEGIHY